MVGRYETNESNTAVGYVRVSTSEQGESGAGLEAQRRTIYESCAARRWQLSTVFEDVGLSGGTLKRSGLSAALDFATSGKACVLVVAKLDRLSRSLMQFAQLMERSRREGWHLVALDLGVDTSTPQGELMANVMATFAQFERRMIGLRTKEALAVRRSQGVRLGRPPAVPADVVDRIRDHRAEGLSYAAIGQLLDADGVPRGHGGQRWYPATVRAVALRTES